MPDASSIETRETRSYDSPAREAAGLLLRIGFGLIVLVAPVAAVYSRRSFAVLVPIGSFLIIVSALVLSGEGFFRRVRAMFSAPLGLVALLLALWLMLSLVWTPFPASAAERAARSLGNGLLALAVAAALPERMRASNLHLMSIGVALATLALSITALIAPFSAAAVNDPEAPTFGRAAVAANVMVWPAVAWTFMRARHWQGIALIVVSALATASSGSLDAAVSLVAALLVFLAARANAPLTGRTMAIATATATVLAPLVAIGARTLRQSLALAPENLISQIGLWADEFLKEPARLLTGHGFDATYRAQLAGMINPNGPDGILPMLWFDLGLPGAVLLAALLYGAFSALRMMGQPLAQTGMAVLTAATVFAFLDPTAMQAWWQSVLIVAGMMMVAVHNGQYRTARPAAAVRAPEMPIQNAERH